ncbi:hypothetical protein NS337_13940 [Pseudomonas oryzihabitans]|nr:hypothetical protein SB14R_07000 [Pseudomonas psychrotolerans]KTT53393.1 hypothetical protein NS337_13940 [Pseudomonas psychrotolerans]
MARWPGILIMAVLVKRGHAMPSRGMGTLWEKTVRGASIGGADRLRYRMLGKLGVGSAQGAVVLRS